MAYKVGFSIPDEDKDVYDYLSNLNRMKSRFIVNCIKNAMNGNVEVNKLEKKEITDKQEIENILRKVIREEMLEVSKKKVVKEDKNLNEAAEKNNDFKLQ